MMSFRILLNLFTMFLKFKYSLILIFISYLVLILMLTELFGFFICTLLYIYIYSQLIVMNLKQAKENIQPLDLAHTNLYTKLYDEQSKQITILFQYKMFQMYGSLLGIYAIPNLDNYKIWNCIIFVKKGFYKDGKFKFDLIFTNQFPYQSPHIVFKSSLFHPLVREDGTVDIAQMLGQQWNYQNENMIYSLFSRLQKMFVDKYKLQVRHSYNPEAAKMLSLKPHTFIERAFQSVELSKDNLYANDPGTSLIIKKYENNELQSLKQKVQQLCQQNKAPEEKRKEFLNYVLTDI